MRALAGLVVVTLLAALVRPPSSFGQTTPSALTIVRRFCQVDGTGSRLHPRRWATVAPLVSWTLEPAWDHVRIISGYQINSPRFFDDHVEIGVDYTVIHQIDAGDQGEVNDAPQIESVRLRVEVDNDGQPRMAGPPPVPHVFATHLEEAALRASLRPSSEYLSDSAFVWRMLTDAGWAIPFQSVSQLRGSSVFAPVETPAAGDLAVFLAAEVPYHVGFVTADGLVASATINAGLMQTSADAFDGAVIYLRLVQPAPSPVATTAPDAQDIEAVSPARSPTAAPSPRPIATKSNRAAGKKMMKSRKPNGRRRRPTAKPHRHPQPRATPTPVAN
ncbi:MAG TPA: hypothetical protein VMW17_14030 [Candidatus Binatia bacterium]|nr:hypothetical protein [Candidatus Binatia bacterium]